MQFSSRSPTLLTTKNSVMPGRSIILLFWLGLATLTSSAQEALIRGELLYSGEEDFSYGRYLHPLIESEMTVIGAGTSDSKGHFQFQVSLSEAQIIQLKRGNDTYPLYLRPGDTLALKILNRFNIEFEGTSKRENEALFKMGFHHVFYVTDPLEDCLLAMDTLETRRQALIQAYGEEKGEVDEDFLRYMKAAVVGNRYDRLNRIYHHHVKDQPENPLLAIASNELLDLPVIDEVRSAAYLNAVLAFVENKLAREKVLDPILSENPSQQWQRRRRIATERIQSAPQLKRYLDFALLAMELWWVEDKKGLEQFEAVWKETKNAFPKDTLHTLLNELYEDRRCGVLLQSLDDISLVDSLGKTVLLSELDRFPALVLLWSDSTELSFELDRLGSLLPPNWNEIQLVAIYLGQDLKHWKAQRAQVATQRSHFHLTKEDSKAFLNQYEVHKTPVYLLFDAPHSLQQAAFEIGGGFYRELYRMTRPR